MNKGTNMKKIVSAAAGIAMILLPVSLSAEKKERYISPNNDGVQDELVIPLKIQERRMISS